MSPRSVLLIKDNQVMKKIGIRPGCDGILLTVVLMFCIVMFIDILFWLFTDTGFLMGSPESSLFKPVAISDDVPRTLKQTFTTL
jgi:hypothetical protein